ncbi:MAG: hypothetical protein EOO59_13815 [Hymenobacter sp.]|nr:MAG: hypothetical protein EOO59_13815 [Hymenobacter sp.]
MHVYAGLNGAAALEHIAGRGDGGALLGAKLRIAKIGAAELQQALATEAKLSPAVAAKQLGRTDFSNVQFGPQQRATIAAAGDVLKRSGTIEASVDVQKTVNELIDPQYATKLAAAPVAVK